ncbi:MAG: copper resistance protein CopC [Actinomycetota bacterium]|nr:copper resistance protein CopC [Actinomycetota bacterium]
MRRGPALLLAIGVAVIATLVVATPASAHNQVVSSTPSAGGTLTELPPTFGLTTNLPLLDIGGQGRGFALEIRDSAGKFYENGCVSITDASMSTRARLGRAGAYTMIYQLVSADGHTVSGEIPFTWAPSGSVTASTGSVAPASCPGSTVKAQAPSGGTGSDATRNSTIPLDDVLWIGGVLLAVAIAVGITLVVLTRRRRA